MIEPLYVVHENHRGERRYQPRLDTGETLRARVSYMQLTGETVESGWTWRSWGDPVLYRSARRAACDARREMRRRERARRNEFKEVEHD